MDVHRWISYLVQELREQKGLTQDQLSEKVGMAYESIKKIEQGTRRIATIHTLIKFAKAFDLAPHFLLPKSLVKTSKLPNDRRDRIYFYACLVEDEKFLQAIEKHFEDYLSEKNQLPKS